MITWIIEKKNYFGVPATTKNHNDKRAACSFNGLHSPVVRTLFPVSKANLPALLRFFLHPSTDATHFSLVYRLQWHRHRIQSAIVLIRDGQNWQQSTTRCNRLNLERWSWLRYRKNKKFFLFCCIYSRRPGSEQRHTNRRQNSFTMYIQALLAQLNNDGMHESWIRKKWTSTDHSNKYFSMRWWLNFAAKIKGVDPLSSILSIFAPFDISNWAIRKWPLLAARCNGVCLSPRFAFSKERFPKIS